MNDPLRVRFSGPLAVHADRLRAEGDPAGAWALLKVAIRASRDMERAVPTDWCRTTAIILIQFAHETVSEWAKEPRCCLT